MLNQIIVEDCLTFPVNLRWFQVLVRCSAATKDCHLIHGMHLGLQQDVFGNQFSTFGSLRDHSQGIQSDDVHRIPGAVPEAGRTNTAHSSEDRQNQGTIPMPTIATRPLTTSSTIPVDLPQNYVIGQQSLQILELHFDKFPDPPSFLVWKIRFKNQVTTCSDFPSKATLWIEEMKMVDWLEELKTSRSVRGRDFPNFEMLDAKTASALNKIIQNSHFKKEVSLEEQKAQKEDGPPRGRQIAYMIYDYFRVTGAHDTVLKYADSLSVTLHDDNIQEFDTRWDEVLLSMSKIPSDDFLEIQNKNMWVRATQNRVEISRHGDSSEDIDAQWSKIEDNGELVKKIRNFDYETLSQTREQWPRIERDTRHMTDNIFEIETPLWPTSRVLHKTQVSFWWEVCTSWGYVSPRNSKSFWNCSRWKFIWRCRCSIITDWRQ